MESAGSLIYNDEKYRKILNKHFKESPHIHQGFFTGLKYEDKITFDSGAARDGNRFDNTFSKVIDDFFVGLFNKAQELYIEELLAPLKIKPEHRILDVGCGVGSNAIWLAKKYGCSVHGIDISGDNIETAKAFVRAQGLEHLITLECCDALDMDCADESFDHAYSVECFYFIEQKEKLLKKLHKFLKKNGVFAISDYVLKKHCGFFTRYLVMCQYGTFKVMLNTLYESLIKTAGFNRFTMRDVTEDTIVPGLNLFKLEDFKSFREEYQALEGHWMGLITTKLVKHFALRTVEKGKYGLNFFYCAK